MNIPAIINYLLTLRYPGSVGGKTNWVCYQGVSQVIIPMFPAGLTINYTGRPLPGTFGLLAWQATWGADIMPNAFTGSVVQYGAIPWSFTITQQILVHGLQYFLLITQQQPDYETVTNISPLWQRYEIFIHFIVIPGERDMETVYDALRRLHTSAQSEELATQANALLRAIGGPRVAPQAPLVGGS